MKQPLFSIITVTYNAQEKIGDTIQSVYNQNCLDYEYILIDGKSQDGTMEIITENKARFREKGIDYQFISENDKGIYDAMNKGVSISRGTWICFMNAGDYLYDSNVLENVKAACMNNNKIGIIYGDREYYKSNGLRKLEKAKRAEDVKDDMPFSHQSCFSKRELLLQHPLDVSYKIGADYEFVMWCYFNGIEFCYLNKTLSMNEFGGLSTVEESEIIMLRENIELKRKYGILDETEYEEEVKNLEKYRRYREFTAKVKRFIPDPILEKRIYRLNVRNGWIKDNVVR